MSSYAARRSLARTNAASLARDEREYKARLAAEAKASAERAKAAHDARLDVARKVQRALTGYRSETR